MSDMTSAYLLIAVIFAVLITLLLVRIGVFKSRKAAISNGVRASGNMAHSVTSVSATRTEMKYCMSCGKQMPSEMNFCGHCGKGQLPTSNSDSAGRAAANSPTSSESSGISGGVPLAIAIVLLGGYLIIISLSAIWSYFGEQISQGKFPMWLYVPIVLGIGALWRAFKKR